MSNLTTQAGANVIEKRELYVGGSDVPTLLGINKYKTPYELALEKVGLKKSDFKGNEYTQYGNVMEPQIRDYINVVNETHFVEATKIGEGIRSNTDGYDQDQNLILEIKTHGKYPTLEVYKSQMQLYMYQFECDQGWLALYERPADFDAEFEEERLKIKKVERDDAYIEKILKEIDLFWGRCAFLKDNPGASEDDFKNFGKSSGGKSMNELQVKTLQFEPAKVEFNFQELFATLDQNLKKYEGLTFTEDDIPEAKKTVADLRKGKKAVDSYRLQTKKKLTKSVTEFEEQCKELNKKFDQVVTPLVSQIEKFEEDRKEEKRKQIQSFIDKLISEQNISSDYSSELIVESDFLTKGKSMKSIKEELTLKAEALVLKQQKFEGDKEIIENTVEIANNRYKTNLLSSAYVKLLQYKEVKEIKTLILDDAQEEVQKRLEKECEQETKTATVIKEKTAPVKDEQTFFEVYKVTGTESQLDALEEFMRQEQIEFEIKEENE